jgi:5-aminopentanamidase
MMDRPLRIVCRLTGRTPPAPGAGLRVAIYQGEGQVGSPEAVRFNLDRMAEAAAKAARYGAQVCVFPEAYTTGYAITSEQCRALAEPRFGVSVTEACQSAKNNGLAVVLPYPELDEGAGGPRFYDAIAVAGPDGDLLANYRKTHLNGAAERRNYSFGKELPPVVQINGFPVGLLNCYECEMPPLYQHLAERGARLVIGPTAADQHFCLADGTDSLVPHQDATRHVIPAMASIWGMFVAYGNRRGWERTAAGWWEYRGNSGIWAPDGETVIAAGPEERSADCLLIADCRPDAHPAFSPEGSHVRDNRLSFAPRMRAGV